MLKQNKILLKQTLLLALISFLFLFLGFLADEDGPLPIIGYELFKLYFVLIIYFFIPISVLYLLRIKGGINLKGLNIVFRFFCWFLISTLSVIYISGLYESFYVTWTGLNFFTSAWISIQFIDTEGMINFLYYTPYIVFAILLYRTIKINKSFNVDNKQELVK